MTELFKLLPGPERILCEPGEDYMKNQLAVDKLQRAAWVRDLADWAVMATFTFRYERGVSCWSAMRIYVRTMQRRLPRVSYYVATEPNPSRDGHHIHALWADCGDVFRRDEWKHWFDRYGRNKIEPVHHPADAFGYASKYLCKAESLVEHKLAWKWRARLHGWTKEKSNASNPLLPPSSHHVSR